MSETKIKWGCVQPLTGGMYLGAEKAIGHPAEWIISYPGLTDIVKDKAGNVVDALNEANIYEYLKSHDRLPNYYTMNRGYLNNEEMLCEVDYEPQYKLDGVDANPDLSNMDLVVAVPVCAGLSMASRANDERKKQCNCQMVWMTNYMLKTIKPKVYIFENAPTLMSGRGDEVRLDLQAIAEKYGYTTVYYKTDTKYHHNCQKRPRTFIMFFKNRDGKNFIPELKYEHDTLSVKDYFNGLVKLDNDPMDVTFGVINDVEIPLAYVNHKFGPNWREKIHGDLFDWVTHKQEDIDEFMSWLKENWDESNVAWYTKHINHIIDKRMQGYGYWETAAKYINNDTIPACMYKNMPVVIHYEEDRLYTMREWLHVMGHPNDFNMIGKVENYFRKIGQNVPVNTAKWVVSEAVRIISNWDNEPTVSETDTVGFYDNGRMKRVWPAKKNDSNQLEMNIE